MAVRRWLHDKLKAVFRRGADRVPAVDVRDALATRGMASTADLASNLARQEITLAQWAAEIGTQVRSATIAQFLLGIGGRDNLTPLLEIHLSQMVGEQLTYLRNFAREIGQGRMTETQIAQRSDLYFDTSIGAYEQGRALSMGYWLPTMPPAHVGCRCELVSGTDGDKATVSWRTAGDEQVCPICSDLESRYDNYVVGTA